MKLSRTLLSCLAVVLPCLVLSDPQNTQNNVGRRKREIMAEILAEAVEAVGRQERSAPAGLGHPDVHVPDVHVRPPRQHQPQHQESPQHHGSSYHKRSAEPQISQNCGASQCNQNNIAAGQGSAGHAGFSSGFFQLPSISQNCINGACNQNNVLGRKKREELAQHQESPQHHGSSYQKRSADPQISQNCAGGRCNQNNIAAGQGSAGHGNAGHGNAGHGNAGHGSAGHAGFSSGFFQIPSISQNCINGACNQNNVLGRKKREVLAHLIEEARKIAEEEVEAEEAISRRKREIAGTGGLNDVNADNIDNSGCLVGPSGERVCQDGAYGSDGESRVLARGNKGPGYTGSNGNAGPVNAAGQAYDPAAETYKLQIRAYQAWAEQQVENAKRQLGTA